MSHFIYVIATVRDDDVLDRPIKIGITSKPKSRLSTLQTGSTEYLKFAALFELPSKQLAKDIEAIVHEALRDFNFIGEWFGVMPSLGAITTQHAIFEARRFITFDVESSARNIA